MIKLTFTIGTQDKDNKELFYNINAVKEFLATKLDYATFTECTGCYKYNDGTVCYEPSLKVEVIYFDDVNFDDNKILNTINTISYVCAIFNQESYLFETQIDKQYSATIVYVK